MTQDKTLWYCETCNKDFSETLAALEHRARNSAASIQIARD